MFWGILFLVLGILILLKAVGILVGSIWNFFWAILFIVIGIKLLARRKKCFMCEWMGVDWFGTAHDKFHEYREKNQKEKN